MRKLEFLITLRFVNNGLLSACYIFEITPEAVVWRCSVEEVFLEISQNSLENTCAKVSEPDSTSVGCF